MSLELNLRFTNAENVEVKLGEEDSGTLPFSNPLTPKDHADLRWYLETYGACSLGDPDDTQARDVKSGLPLIGKALFDAVFSERASQRLFDRFQDTADKDRQLTIAGEQADVLSLPWELLHDSASGGAFLFRERPAVSIRRKLAGATGGRKPFKVESKDTLRLLFVVSRPEHEAGFFGRRRELWDIECWFAGTTERISITGFGGQGKTELALEAGRWLTRKGQFKQAVFVDYSQIQADAPESVVRVAVSHIGSVLDRSLTDAQEATSALRDTPTLVILDNLEVLSPESLQALLDAAVLWSRAGDSRVLLTSRTPEFDHPDYATAGTFKHRQINLTGLGDKSRPDDALEWFAALSKLPPAPDAGLQPPSRDELIELFDQVRFHPLSIAVLAQQLKSRQASELGQRLEQLLAGEASSSGRVGSAHQRSQPERTGGQSPPYNYNYNYWKRLCSVQAVVGCVLTHRHSKSSPVVGVDTHPTSPLSQTQDGWH